MSDSVLREAEAAREHAKRALQTAQANYNIATERAKVARSTWESTRAHAQLRALADDRDAQIADLKRLVEQLRDELAGER